MSRGRFRRFVDPHRRLRSCPTCCSKVTEFPNDSRPLLTRTGHTFNEIRSYVRSPVAPDLEALFRTNRAFKNLLGITPRSLRVVNPAALLAPPYPIPFTRISQVYPAPLSLSLSPSEREQICQRRNIPDEYARSVGVLPNSNDVTILKKSPRGIRAV